MSTNYSCVAQNSDGEDRLSHIIHVMSPPDPPLLETTKTTFSGVNLTINSGEDGGAPILGKF